MRNELLALAGGVLLIAGGTASSAQTPNTDNHDSAIGINLEWNTFRMPRVAFANAMKTGRKWQQSTLSGLK